MIDNISLNQQKGLSLLSAGFYTARSLKLLGIMMFAVLFHCAFRPVFFREFVTDEMYFRLLFVFSGGAVVLGLIHSMEKPRCYRKLVTEREFRRTLVIFAVVFAIFVVIDPLALTHPANNSEVPVFRIFCSALILTVGGSTAERRCKARGAK